MPRRAVTRRNDTPALSDSLANNRNAPPDPLPSAPDTQRGVEDIFSGVLPSAFSSFPSSPSRKRRVKPTIQSAAITGQEGDAPHPPGTLYLVAVPIGCLDDISLRALRVLRESALILCENAAVSHSLTEHFGIAAPLMRYGRQSAGQKNGAWLDRLLAGENLAFVCDAGTPGIADPGQSLVRAALQRSISVVAIPGPAAVLVALVASGLSTERFVFDGFPPRIPADREVFFTRLAQEERTILLYESGRALVSTLKALCAGGNQTRPAAVASRLTHPTEDWFRGTLQEALAHFQKRRPQGEYTLVIAGNTV